MAAGYRSAGLLLGRSSEESGFSSIQIGHDAEQSQMAFFDEVLGTGGVVFFHELMRLGVVG